MSSSRRDSSAIWRVASACTSQNPGCAARSRSSPARAFLAGMSKVLLHVREPLLDVGEPRLQVFDHGSECTGGILAYGCGSRATGGLSSEHLTVSVPGPRL